MIKVISLFLFFLFYLQAGLASGVCTSYLSESVSKRDKLFLQQIKKASVTEPNGVELEIDLESVFENLEFNPYTLEPAAYNFCANETVRTYMMRALKDEHDQQMFDAEDREEMDELLESWIELAHQSDDGSNQEIVDQLVTKLKEDESFAATVLKLSMLKAMSNFNRKHKIAAEEAEVKEVLLTQITELSDPESAASKQLKNMGVVAYTLEHALRQHAKDIKSLLGERKFIGFLTNLSEIIALQNDRHIMGVEFIDPKKSPSVETQLVSPTGHLSFLNLVEDRNPYSEIPQLTSGIELHAISSSTPSATQKLVQKRVQDLSDVPSLYTSLHVHVVAPIFPPRGNKHISPLNTMLLRLEHGRRLEMLAQMATVIFYNQPIRSRGANFRPMVIRDVVNFFNGFPEYWVKDKKENFTHRSRAFGYVSFTGPGKYQPLKGHEETANTLFGYEFRFILAEEDPDSLAFIMDDAKYFLEAFKDRDHFAELPPRFNNYFLKFLKAKIKKQVVGNSRSTEFDAYVSYLSSFHAAQALFESAFHLGNIQPTDSQGFFSAPQNPNKFNFEGSFNAESRSKWGELYPHRSSDPDYEVAFLFHNWGRDPLLFDRPDLLPKIRGAQRRAKNRLSGNESTQQIVKDFLLESGIFQIYKNSIREIH